LDLGDTVRISEAQILGRVKELKEINSQIKISKDIELLEQAKSFILKKYGKEQANLPERELLQSYLLEQRGKPFTSLNIPGAEKGFLKALFRSEADFLYSLFSDGYENCEYSILDEYMPYIRHIHGKCFEFQEDGEEYRYYDYYLSRNYLDECRTYLNFTFEKVLTIKFNKEITDYEQGYINYYNNYYLYY
jgi:hypothetical protein